MTFHLQRGWWKAWNWSTRTWILVMLSVTLASPFITRWVCLWKVPNVQLPFDVESTIREDVPKNENAVTRYLAAEALLQTSEQDWSAIRDVIVPIDKVKWDNRLDQWLLNNREALSEYLATTEMKLAAGPSLRTADITTDLPRFVYAIRGLAIISTVEAMRCERSGKLDEAWNWYRANLRCALHADVPGYWGRPWWSTMVRRFTCPGIACWAQQPSLTAERLRNARTEISEFATKRRSPVEYMKMEYLVLRNTLRRTDLPNQIFNQWDSDAPYEQHLLVLKRLGFWMVGEPELTQRLARQFVVNNYDQIDRPYYARRKHIGQYPSLLDTKPASGVAPSNRLVFERDSEIPRQPGQLEARSLYAALDSPVVEALGQQSVLFGRVAVWDVEWFRPDDARLVMIDVVLASHEYQRIYGEFPSTLEQLVPDYLSKVPCDPMDATGGPIHYRRDTRNEALVWTVGNNGVDDGGDIDGKEYNHLQDAGYRLSLKYESEFHQDKSSTVPDDTEAKPPK